MAFNNRNNLNPQSAPWGREVEQKIDENERGLSGLRALTENNNKATNATLGALSRQQDSIIATQAGLEAAQAQVASVQAAYTTASYSDGFSLVTVPGGFGEQVVQLATFSVSSPSESEMFLTRLCSLEMRMWATLSNYTGSFTQNPELGLRLRVPGYLNIEASVSETGRFFTDTSPGTQYTFGTEPVTGFSRKRAEMLSSYAPNNQLVLEAVVFRPMTGGTYRISGSYSIMVETVPDAAVETITPI